MRFAFDVVVWSTDVATVSKKRICRPHYSGTVEPAVLVGYAGRRQLFNGQVTAYCSSSAFINSVVATRGCGDSVGEAFVRR